MEKLFFYDLETTGLDLNKHAIHQIAGAVLVNNKMEYFNFNVRPFEGALIDTKALEIAKVTKEQIMAYPDMNTVYKQLIELLSTYVDRFNRKDKFFLVGYNNRSFDDPFFRKFFQRNKDKYFGSWFWSVSLDVMPLAGLILKPEIKNMENFKLVTVAKKLGINVDESKLHDARYDIYLTKKIYDKCTEKLI